MTTVAGNCIGPLNTNDGSKIGIVNCETALLPQQLAPGAPGYRPRLPVTINVPCGCGGGSATGPSGPLPTGNPGYNCPCGDGQNGATVNDGSQMLVYKVGSQNLCWRASGITVGSSIVLANCDSNSFSQYFTYHTDNGIIYTLKHYTSVSSSLCVEYVISSSSLKVMIFFFFSFFKKKPFLQVNTCNATNVNQKIDASTGQIRAGTPNGACIAPVGYTVGSGIGSVNCTSSAAFFLPDGINNGPPGYRSFAFTTVATCACGNQAYTQPPKPSSTYGPMPTNGYNCPCGDSQNGATQNDGSEMLYYTIGSMKLCWRASGTSIGSTIVLANCDNNSFSQYFTFHTDNGTFYTLKHYTGVSTYLCVYYDTTTLSLKVLFKCKIFFLSYELIPCT